MSDKVIIDGVDVSKCQYFQFEDDEYTCKAEEGCECVVVACRSYTDCYFKQLQRLKEENRKLKAENKKLKEENIEIKEDEIMQRIINIELMQKWDENSEDYKNEF